MGAERVLVVGMGIPGFLSKGPSAEKSWTIHFRMPHQWVSRVELGREMLVFGEKRHQVAL